MDTKQQRGPRRRQADGCCSPAPIEVSESAAAEHVQVLAALSDPTRLQIVEMLSGLAEPLCVCEIVPHFALGQPTISHHLRVLREAKLVTWEKRGLWVYYSLDREVLGRSAAYLDGIASRSEDRIRLRTA